MTEEEYNNNIARIQVLKELSIKCGWSKEIIDGFDKMKLRFYDNYIKELG